ncbi:hypothetical protein [Burkholderia pseudomallei]|uniref:hypothetical protein n=1 Tax=Burkholderia pseudomallei TaxID=28450 RepID=UPI0009B22A6E|nr:hypothetical protein [Burkholderia pseudomallei]
MLSATAAERRRSRIAHAPLRLRFSAGSEPVRCRRVADVSRDAAGASFRRYSAIRNNRKRGERT